MSSYSTERTRPATGQARPEQKIVLPGQTPDGQPVLSVLVKRTYRILRDSRCIRAEVDRKLIPGDVHFGDPMNSTVQFESDFVPYKLATDVVLNGHAHAPGGQPVRELTASLVIGSYHKDLRVIGDRVCKYRVGGAPLFSEPEPFTKMELRYERAYGGVDIYSDRKLACPYARNHLGRGYAIRNIKEVIENLQLPNLEDPNDLLTPDRICIGNFIHWENQPMPQSFGWFSKYWRPRALLAGVMPADRPLERELRQAYAQLIPPNQKELYAQTELPDMDFRFFNGASQGLAVPFLSGHEVVRLLHLERSGELIFKLPGERPRIGLDIGYGIDKPEVVLHTVMIRIEDAELDLVWRAATPYPGLDWLPEMRKMEVLIE